MADELAGRGIDDEVGAEGDEMAPAEGVLTLVCLTCGEEYYFTDFDPPEGMSCERCASVVFRSFFTPTDGDAVMQDFQDSTARDLDPDDAEGEAMPGDVMDLNSQ